MERKYFGTDGIRGEVGTSPMTPDFVLKLGWAAGKVLATQKNPLVVIGKDTRISGYMLESALEAGLVAAGVNIRLLGPMPTPAVAYLTRTFRASAGIVVSASHNPYQDNGVKFFSSLGMKLPDQIEQDIEAYIEKDLVSVPSHKLGKVVRVDDASGRYIEFCKRAFPTEKSLEGLRIVVDCANGATYHVTPHVLSELGADVITLANSPNGLNINEECGATSLKMLSRQVITHNADLGIALDGDGDRIMMIDHTGAEVDGDEILAIITRHRQSRETSGQDIVGTQMSNLGLEHAVKSMGLNFHRTKVGDRHVMEKLLQCNGILGGESSGHIIVRDRIETGDGTIAGLQVLNAMVDLGESLHSLKQVMTKYPQTLVNVALNRRLDLGNNSVIQSAVNDVEAKLANRGRILLRASGTQPLIRVMVEGEDSHETSALANEVADTVRQQAAA